MRRTRSSLNLRQSDELVRRAEERHIQSTPSSGIPLPYQHQFETNEPAASWKLTVPLKDAILSALELHVKQHGIAMPDIDELAAAYEEERKAKRDKNDDADSADAATPLGQPPKLATTMMQDYTKLVRFNRTTQVVKGAGLLGFGHYPPEAGHPSQRHSQVGSTTLTLALLDSTTSNLSLTLYGCMGNVLVFLP
ncbi:hypothetical protein CONLIGDRAFT_295480 [Coniochaeta ligniaria NRRL 30616]|uniref:Uncharacterized protein n=1 Tax=Coniochaeta ligniaria NRRL 30616 TaxID=1408157 RepID=A0A1J7JM55_9PEZI|nr:hypothetical protein CONLIGDRAFT_295480 [Coniochaeta ligniaria NRRL 30616]